MATCALGLEELLLGELEQLGFGRAKSRPGAVEFEGKWPDVWFCNLWLRTANRVLVELGRGRVASDEDLYRGARSILGRERLAGVATRELFNPEHTLAVFATTGHSRIKDSRWVALKVKDAIVDAQREQFRNARSSIDTKRPDMALRVWLHRDEGRIYLDSSREPLDRRGYRVQSGAAPVREQVAAACALAARWDGEGAVVDPMCGTGTLLIEAAWLALGWAPGRLREHWTFSRWPGFDRAKFEAMPRDRGRPPEALRLLGVDNDRAATNAARRNLEAAGLDELASVRRGDGYDLEPPAGGGLVLINPPFGERLGSSPESWKKIGDLLKQRYAGYKAVVLAGDEDRGKHIGLRPDRRIPVRVGKLDARILPFTLYAGSAETGRQEGDAK